MEIFAKITGIEYHPHLITKLKEYNIDTLENFNINDIEPYCIINFNNFKFGLSKWVSPKRTRSYPYERVYNTLKTSKRITIIPVIKDEGKNGDRDFLQWDTVSLMSLLDIFVILAYYNDADKHPNRDNKVTNQKFDSQWIICKIKEIQSYHSSALHWNIKEISNTLPILAEKSKIAYKNISHKLGVEFHNPQNVDRYIDEIKSSINKFITISRQKAKDAQNREIQTLQPKEHLVSDTKAKLTIENYLGGKYYFTTDEVFINKNDLYLIESKHSNNSVLPSMGDIKDGLLKMILYCNLKDVTINDKKFHPIPTLKLTSSKINERILDLNSIKKCNELNEKQKMILKSLFEEAKQNNFQVIIEKSNYNDK